MVNNPPFNAGNVDLIPGQGTKIPYATGHLSPCSATGEADLPPRRPSTAKTEREIQYFKNTEGTPIKTLLDYRLETSLQASQGPSPPCRVRASFLRLHTDLSKAPHS